MPSHTYRFIKTKLRANHYHKKTIQWNYVISGKLIFVSKINGKIKKVVGNKDDLVKIETKEHHAIKALSSSEILVFTTGQEVEKEYEKRYFQIKKI